MRNITTDKSIADVSAPNLKRYFEEVRKLSDPIPRDLERTLIARAKQGCEWSRNSIIESNLKFVVTTAKHYNNGNLPLEDLISEGNYGLCKAIDKFSLESDVKFISYAVWWIRESIISAIRKHSRNVRMSSGNSKLVTKINRFISQYYNENQFDPEPFEIAEQLNLTEQTVINTLSSMQFSVPLETDCTETESVIDWYEVNDKEYDDTNAQKRILSDLIKELLPDVQAAIITSLYVDEMHIEDVSDMLGLTINTINKLNTVGINQLKNHPDFLIALISD